MTLPQPPKIPPTNAELIALYEKAQADLVKEIVILANKGNIGTVQFKRALLTEINLILDRLLRSSLEWVQDAIPAAYATGVIEADAAILELFKAAGVDPPKFPRSFAVIDNKVVEILLEGANSTFENIALTVQDGLQAQISEATKDVVKDKVVTGQTIKQAQAKLLTSLERQGISAFNFKRGGKTVSLPLKSYAETVIRSTTAEVTNQASIRRSQQVSGDLVKMTAHATSCPICWPLQGRVYSISGSSKIYPPLETAFSNGHANIHPNCRHRINPYIPALKTPTEIKKDQAFSQRPFDIPNMSRSQQNLFNKQIKAYNTGQNVKRTLNANNKQWIRYSARLGDDAPKTLASFVSIKNKDGDAWENMQSDFRSAGIEVP